MDTQAIRKKVLDLALQGKLTEQLPEDGTAEELYQEIQREKQALEQAGKVKKTKLLLMVADEEKPYKEPENWTWVRLGSIITLVSGTDFKPEDYNAIGDGLPYMTGASNIENGKLIINRWTPFPQNIAYEGDLLLVCKGSGFGKLVICNVAEVHIARQFMSIRPCKSIDVQYIMAVMSNSLQSIKEAGKGLIPGVDRETVLNIKVPLPPLDEQHRIVEKIESIFSILDTIDTLQTQYQNNLATLKSKLIDAAIQGKLTEQLPEDGTAEELYQEIQREKQALEQEGKIKKSKPLPPVTDDEMPFDIPISWKWVSVDNVCINIQYGTSKKSANTGKIPVIRMGNLRDGRIVYDKLAYTSDDDEIAKYSLEINDLLFNRTNSMELVGKAAIYKGELKAIYAGYLVRITPLIMVSDYLNYVMQSKFYWDYCSMVRSDANGQSNINAEKLKRFVFPLPPLAEQRRIVAKLEELLAVCEQ